MSNKIGMNCPHCGHRAVIRTSIERTRTMRELYFLCPNLLCGHSWVSMLEAIRTISPPSEAFRHPDVNLPVSSRNEVYLLNDQFSREATGQLSLLERSIFDDI